MRDVEYLLEFHRLRDLFSDSMVALGKLAHAANRLQPQLRVNGHADRRGRGAGRGVGSGQVAACRSAPHAPGDTMPGPVSVDATVEAQIAEAAKELGLGDPRSAEVQRALGYASYAWTEYEQVVRKYEAAMAATTARVSEEAQRAEAQQRDSAGNALKKSASSNSLGETGSAHCATSIRRANSEPSTPTPPNPLALSLSMISAHVNDDDDDAGTEPEEW